MLTPDVLEDLEKNNKIVEMYRQLNKDIVVDIIRRLLKNKNIDSLTKSQLRTLLETGGNDIYRDILLKVDELSEETRNELNKLYKRMTNEDLKAYVDLYEYRDLDLKLNKTQVKILNNGILTNSKELKNFTNTIAFASKQLYVDTVDQAYFNVVTGGLDYNTAIENSVRKLVEKGVTLKDAAGRNVKLTTAVRRNILTGIKQTADRVNKNIDEMLGCDGYETTAHAGARPTHAVWQGKQFARTKQLAKEYGVEYWGTSDAKEELNDYGCRHTYFGIILGISKPIYSQKELKELNNEKNYEKTQKKNSINSKISNLKEQNEIYEKVDSKITNELKKENGFKIANLEKQLKYPTISKYIDMERTVIGNSLSTKIIEKYINTKNVIINRNINAYMLYNLKQDKIIINPDFANAKMFDTHQVLTHEISHMLDVRTNFSSGNIDTNKAYIDNCYKYILKNKSKISEMLQNDKIYYDEDISNLIEAMSRGKILGNVYHGKDYYKNLDYVKIYSEMNSSFTNFRIYNNKHFEEIIKLAPALEVLYNKHKEWYDDVF